MGRSCLLQPHSFTAAPPVPSLGVPMFPLCLGAAQCWDVEQDLTGSPMDEMSPSPYTPLGTTHSPSSITGHKESNKPIISCRTKSSHPSLPEHEDTAPHLPEWGEPICTMGSAWHGGAAGPGMAAVRTASIFSSKNQNHQKEKAKKKQPKS